MSLQLNLPVIVVSKGKIGTIWKGTTCYHKNSTLRDLRVKWLSFMITQSSGFRGTHLTLSLMNLLSNAGLLKPGHHNFFTEEKSYSLMPHVKAKLDRKDQVACFHSIDYICCKTWLVIWEQVRCSYRGFRYIICSEIILICQ